MSGLCEWQRRFLSVCLICLLCFAVYACGQKQDPMEKIKDLEYTVIAEDNIPEELLEKIEERKENAFKLTFEDILNLSLFLHFFLLHTENSSKSSEAEWNVLQENLLQIRLCQLLHNMKFYQNFA